MEERKYNFYDVAYEYLKDDYPANYHTVEELTRKVPLIPSPNDDTDPIGTFENTRKDLSKDLSDIMKIFGIESFSKDFKINGEYQFTQKDVSFLANTLRHYRQMLVWKKGIKHALNYTLEKRNFIQLYQESADPSVFAEEVNRTARGFLSMYSSLNTVSETAKKAFQKAMAVATQYPSLNVLLMCSELGQNALDICPSPEDLQSSINGVLLSDYNQWLDTVAYKLNRCFNSCCKTWNKKKTTRKKEYNDWLRSIAHGKAEIVSGCIERMRQYIEQKYPGYLLNDDLDIIPAKTTSSKCKQIRQETCDVRSMLQDALSHEFQEHKVEFTVFAEYYQLI